MGRKSTRPASPPADDQAPAAAAAPQEQEGAAAAAADDAGHELGAEATEPASAQGATPPAADEAAAPAAAPPVKTVRALVLLDSIYGRINEVKDFEPALAAAAAKAGFLDLHPAAVAFGERLKKGG